MDLAAACLRDTDNTVGAIADEVFALLTETGRLPEWNTRIRRVLELARPDAITTRLRNHPVQPHPVP